MTPADARASARALQLIPLALAGTAVVLSVLGWNVIASARENGQANMRNVRLTELRGTIVHLDAVLTMSASMAAATGELRWANHYDTHEPELTEALREARSLAGGAAAGTAVKQTTDANTALAQIEHRALALVRRRELDSARALLVSPAYVRYGAAYRGGMERLDAAIARSIASPAGARPLRRLYVGLGAATLLVPLLLIGWLMARRELDRSRQALRDRATDLARLNLDLDAKVAERTQALELEVIERTRAVSDALAATRAKSEFLANMSHELRTPLNSVIGFAGVLLRNKNGQLHPQDAAYIQRIHDNGKHLLGLINTVLDLAKVESGKLDAEFADAALGTLVDETLAQLQGNVQGRPVALLAEYPVDLAPLRTDAAKLKQVLINLVGNALKFTEAGSVTVRIVADAAGRPVRVDVIDTGIGIPQDRQSAVFEAFQQADNTTARRFGGTGLGLAISSSLLELLGYRVTLTSAVGEGSTFSVHFTGRDAGADANRVLVIAGSDSHRDLLAQRVRDAGGTAVIAAPDDALNPDGEPPSGLVIIGVQVPEMLGLEGVETLRQHAEAQGARTLVVGIVTSKQRGATVAAAELLDGAVTPEALTASVWRQLEAPPSAAQEHLAILFRQVFRGSDPAAAARNSGIALTSASLTPTSTTVSPG